MSILTVYHVSSTDLPNKVLTHAEDIASTLAEHGVHFDQWHATAQLDRDSSDEQVIAAYRQPLEALQSKRGYPNVAVMRGAPGSAERRASLLGEHTLDEDLVHFFVTGRGLYCMHVDDYVYALVCEKQDVIVIPKGMAHWQDSAGVPGQVMISLSKSEKGGDLTFTGDEVASLFPLLDD